MLPDYVSLNEANNIFTIFKDFTYLFLERGERREKEKERNINWWPLTRPLLGTWPATQARALTGNEPVTLRVAGWQLHPLSHPSQGS